MWFDYKWQIGDHNYYAYYFTVLRAKIIKTISANLEELATEDNDSFTIILLLEDAENLNASSSFLGLFLLNFLVEENKLWEIYSFSFLDFSWRSCQKDMHFCWDNSNCSEMKLVADFRVVFKWSGTPSQRDPVVIKSLNNEQVNCTCLTEGNLSSFFDLHVTPSKCSVFFFLQRLVTVPGNFLSF